MVVGLSTLAHCRLASAKARSRPSLVACRDKGRTDRVDITQMRHHRSGRTRRKIRSLTAKRMTLLYTRQAQLEPAKWKGIAAPGLC